MESDDVASEKGEPRPEKETSSAQWTRFFGVAITVGATFNVAEVAHVEAGPARGHTRQRGRWLGLAKKSRSLRTASRMRQSRVSCWWLRESDASTSRWLLAHDGRGLAVIPEQLTILTEKILRLHA